MRSRFFQIFFLLALITSSLSGQDQHFTQFYNAPLTINPALTGALPGKYRFSLIYRDQGRSQLDVPFTTFSGAVDLRLGLSSARKRKKDAVGIGVVFYSDKSASVNFFNNQIALSTAFHKALNKEANQFLSVGFQAGVNQRNVNYDNFFFDDQFDGSGSYNDPTLEILPENNFSFTDLAAGIHYSYAPENGLGVFAGLGLFHILEPEISFYAGEDQDFRRNSNTLLTKYNAHLGLQMPLSPGIQLLPRAMAHKQGPHLTVNGGANLRFLLSDIRGTALHLGGWARGVDNDEESIFTLNTVVAMVGFEYSNFLIGFSYDVKMTALNTAGRNPGAFEISLAFLGDYDDSAILCPRF